MMRHFLTAGIILASLSGVAAAQSTTEAAPTRLWSVDSVVAERNRAEDLQILSTIVTENVHGLYGVESRRIAGGTDATGPQSGALSSLGAWLYVAGGHPTTATPSRALGEYLPGYGVVVQMEVASPREPATKKAGQAEKPRPPSRWERTRRRLSGDEKSAAYDQSVCSSCHDASVKNYGGKSYADYDGDGDVDVYLSGHEGGGHPAPTKKQLLERLIETLAENGHNLRNLAADERVTLSVSWQPPAITSDPHLILRGYLNEGSGKPKSVEKPKPGSATDPKAPGAKEGSDGGKSSPRSNAELSGDLLLAKGQYVEAAQAFQQAIDDLNAKAGDPLSATDAQTAQARALTLKLAYARAYLTAEGAAEAPDPNQDSGKGGSGNPAERIKAVAAYEKLLSTYGPRRARAARPTAAGRISITATKDQLDQVASGKLTREQFVQKVVVREFEPARAIK
jgi:hypothetical protein